jgi:rSAM/selenodomain-associated transferase 1
MNDRKNCLMVFVRDPEKGKIKSRLAASLGQEATRKLYRCFVVDLLGNISEGDYRIAICFHPPDSGHAISEWLGPDYLYAPQTGEDLGERMENAFREAFAGGYLKAALIGSDLPDLPPDIVEEAFRKLDDCQSVIGPATDGGYYLIGFRREYFSPVVFDGIEWGTGSVFGATIRLLHMAGRTVHVLPQWRDMDRIGDLVLLFKQHINTDFAGSRTMSFLRPLRKLI